MAAPTSPYTTSILVASLMGTTLKLATDFSTSSTVTKTQVDQFISWISSQIDLQFSMAGYTLPLAELSGETWPTSQTTWLQITATLGAVAMAGGYAQKPLPAIAPGRGGGSGNTFQDLYQAELNKIYNPQTKQTYLNFRAQYRVGTPAQIALTDPRGPTSDFMEGRLDPVRYYDNWCIADSILNVQAYLESLGIAWDYMYDYAGLNRGIGVV